MDRCTIDFLAADEPAPPLMQANHESTLEIPSGGPLVRRTISTSSELLQLDAVQIANSTANSVVRVFRSPSKNVRT